MQKLPFERENWGFLWSKPTKPKTTLKAPRKKLLSGEKISKSKSMNQTKMLGQHTLIVKGSRI